MRDTGQRAASRPTASRWAPFQSVTSKSRARNRSLSAMPRDHSGSRPTSKPARAGSGPVGAAYLRCSRGRLQRPVRAVRVRSLDWSGKPDSNRRPSAWECAPGARHPLARDGKPRKIAPLAILPGRSFARFGRVLHSRSPKKEPQSIARHVRSAEATQPGGRRPLRRPQLVSGAVAWLTVSDVAKQLRVSSATVYRLIDSGELRHGRVSNAIRISQADLAAFLRGDS